MKSNRSKIICQLTTFSKWHGNSATIYTEYTALCCALYRIYDIQYNTIQYKHYYTCIIQCNAMNRNNTSHERHASHTCVYMQYEWINQGALAKTCVSPGKKTWPWHNLHISPGVSPRRPFTLAVSRWTTGGFPVNYRCLPRTLLG